MAPSKQEKVPPFSKDERVLCFHGDLMYEAKIMEVRLDKDKKIEDAQYRIHYKGWKASWDDWVSHDRIRKFTEDNKQLAAQLVAQSRMRTQGPKGGKKGVKPNGSEMSSARGSEERAAGSNSFAGRGPRRGRDYELENPTATRPTRTASKMGEPSSTAEKRPKRNKRSITLADYDLPPKRTRSRTKAQPQLSSLDPVTPTTADADCDSTHKTEHNNAPPVLPAKAPVIPAKAERPTSKKLGKSGTSSSMSSKKRNNAVNLVAGKQDDATRIAHFEAKEAGYELDERLHPQTKNWSLSKEPPRGYRYVDAKKQRILFDQADFEILSSPKRPIEVNRTAGVPSSRPYRPHRDAHQDAVSYSKFESELHAAIGGNANREIQEDTFHSRPSVKLIVPDGLKALLVDDWENVTKNMQLVPLPHPKPVTKILEDYAAYEAPKRPAGSSQIDILEETLSGLKDYFDRSLGRILLYRFERAQYAEMHKKWASDPEFQGKTASDTYGAEHLMRLMVSLPELIAQTNMDQQSVNRLREELSKLCAWLSKSTGEYFVSNYESPTADYLQSAKN